MCFTKSKNIAIEPSHDIMVLGRSKDAMKEIMDLLPEEKKKCVCSMYCCFLATCESYEELYRTGWRLRWLNAYPRSTIFLNLEFKTMHLVAKPHTFLPFSLLHHHQQ
jgi:hypothetical protein